MILFDCSLLPESAYFLADTGRTEEAEENLRKVKNK